MTGSEHRKQKMLDSFKAIAGNYDGLRFVQVCAYRLVELAVINEDSLVLDLATGTGMVALNAAQLVGPDGRVTGLDFSPDMLNKARDKAASLGLFQMDFQQGDAQHLDFPDQTFDLILCASAFTFFPDPLAALRECRRVLKPGGSLLFNTFGPGFLQPLNQLWVERLEQYGVPPTPLPNQRLNNPAECEEILREAGFRQTDVREEQLGYYLTSPQQRWEEIEAGLEGLPWFRLQPEERQQVRAEHLAELQERLTANGLWVDVPVLWCFARR